MIDGFIEGNVLEYHPSEQGHCELYKIFDLVGSLELNDIGKLLSIWSE
jgi:hypothetical protein